MVIHWHLSSGDNFQAQFVVDLPLISLLSLISKWCVSFSTTRIFGSKYMYLLCLNMVGVLSDIAKPCLCNSIYIHRPAWTSHGCHVNDMCTYVNGLGSCAIDMMLLARESMPLAWIGTHAIDMCMHVVGMGNHASDLGGHVNNLSTHVNVIVTHFIDMRNREDGPGMDGLLVLHWSQGELYRFVHL